MPDDVRHHLRTLRTLFNEETLLLSMAIDLPLSIDDVREPIVQGLHHVRWAIDEVLRVLPPPD